MSLSRFSSITEQVTDLLRTGIHNGRWQQAMPGRTRLALELQVSHKTIERALCNLETEGLILGQGKGRKRLIVEAPENVARQGLRIAFLKDSALPYEIGDMSYILELRHRLEEAGHTIFFSEKSLKELGMDVGRIAAFVTHTEADAWIIIAGSHPVLEWFSKYSTPSFALFGRRKGIPIASAGPDKPPVCGSATRHLIALGHQRITMIVQKQHRSPKPGGSAEAFLKEIKTAGISSGTFNLPDWEESKEGFVALLESLFEHTPPTAIILDEAFQFHAAVYFLATRGIRIPKDVSLVCMDSAPSFAWCEPSVAHIHWDARPVVRRIVRWIDNVARGKEDKRQTLTKAKFIEGGTIGAAPKANSRNRTTSSDPTTSGH